MMYPWPFGLTAAQHAHELSIGVNQAHVYVMHMQMPYVWMYTAGTLKTLLTCALVGPSQRLLRVKLSVGNLFQNLNFSFNRQNPA